MEIISLTPDCLNTTHRLDGKVILITGAGQGIGRSVALHLARLGATLVLVGKSLKSLESLYDEIMQEKLPEPAIHPINLLKIMPDDAIEMRKSLEQMLGRLDAVIHNAGITGPITPISHMTPEKWQEVIHLNLNVPYLLTHALLPLLAQTENASILFTIADESLSPKAYWSAYNASKAALLNFAKTLHQEMESNTTLRINAINPRVARTALRTRAYPALDPNTFPQPDTLAPFYSYVLADERKALRGKQFNINLSESF